MPSWISTAHQYHVSLADDWKVAVESLRTITEFAASLGITMMIEPINRYRVGLVHTIAEALKMASEVNMPNIAIVPDTFHMNMEESLSIPNALIAGGAHVKTLHVGENNRSMPGLGALDWPKILLSLEKIGFDGCLSHEPVSLYFNENQIAAEQEHFFAFEQELSESVKFLTRCMKEVSTS